MFESAGAVSAAIYDLLKWKLNIQIVITGAIATLFWMLIGWFFWSSLYGLSSGIMGFLPFTMLKSDGAYIFISVLWFLGTMVTFALVIMFFGELIARKKEENYFLPLLIIGISLVWAFVIFLGFDSLYAAFERILASLPFEFTQESIATVMAIYLLYNGLILTMAALASLRSKNILEKLRDEQYPSESLLGDEKDTFRSTLRDITLFAGMSIIAFPFLFIPVLNIIIQFGLWIWLYRDMFKRDVCALYCNEGEKATVQKHRWEFWIVSVIASLMSFVPFINFFAPYFGEVTMFHFVMNIKDTKED